MSTRSVDPDSRENSPNHDESGEKRTSKKRKVLSCYACRSRKMKCDRVYPVCGRCSKTGRADQCSYDPRLLEEAQVQSQPLRATASDTTFTVHDNGLNENAGKDDSTDNLRWKLRLQESKIEMLQRKLASATESKSLSEYRTVESKELDIPEEMMFRGKGFKTQFHGTTSVMSMISQYRDLQAFTRETLTVDNSMRRVKKDFKSFRDRRKVLLKEKIARTYGTDEELFALLPPKFEVDIRVQLYFRTWETTYRILHEPTFLQEYDSFWQRQPSDEQNAGFAAILVLIVAATKCLDVKDDLFVGDSTADRDAACNILETCEMWLNRQPRKRLTLRFFQLQCLALIAKRVNCVKLKQDWLTAGDVVRLALASGMHRDPFLLATGRISEFEKEMKKRLWYTIAELEIQSSIDNGLQSSLTSLYFDTPPPANLPDDAFSVETRQMPTSLPSEHSTSSSYLNIALESLPLRIHLTRLLNDPSNVLRYTEVLHYDEQITSILAKLPSWTGPRTAVPSTLLGLQLRQYLLILHKPYAKQAFVSSRFMYSFTTCVEVASAIISAHEDLNSAGILALNHFRNDAIRVGMTLSQIACMNCARLGMESSVPPSGRDGNEFANPDRHVADMNVPPFANKGGFAPPSSELYLPVLPRQLLPRTLIITCVEILDKTLQLFERKVMRLGTGYMEYWLLSAAIGMLPPLPTAPTSILHITNKDDDMRSRCKKALDRFTSLAFKVLAMQSDPMNPLAASLRTTMTDTSPSDERTPSMKSTNRYGSSGMVGEMHFPTIEGSAGVDKDPNVMTGTFDTLGDMNVDLSGWTFPDFWAFDLAGDF